MEGLGRVFCGCEFGVLVCLAVLRDLPRGMLGGVTIGGLQGEGALWRTGSGRCIALGERGALRRLGGRLVSMAQASIHS